MLEEHGVSQQRPLQGPSVLPGLQQDVQQGGLLSGRR